MTSLEDEIPVEVTIRRVFLWFPGLRDCICETDVICEKGKGSIGSFAPKFHVTGKKKVFDRRRCLDGSTSCSQKEVTVNEEQWWC